MFFNDLKVGQNFTFRGEELQKINLIIIKSVSTSPQHEANAQFLSGPLKGQFLYLDPKRNWLAYI